MKKALPKLIYSYISFLGLPFTFLSAVWLKLIRQAGSGKIENNIFSKVGLLPVHDHYYQPLINPRKHIKKSLREDRFLPGIEMNVDEQVQILSAFSFNEELLQFPLYHKGNDVFFYNNGAYQSGDAEYLYNLIRYYKPLNIIEIGSGYSTLMASNAVKAIKRENPQYLCEHICIEPYEANWLEKTGVTLIREKVENIPLSFFKKLGKNDILFIDSSHIIRPQGDVLYEYLELLPTLNPGVIVHIHDIFTPKDYLDEWIYNSILWNEQYLLEAFLSFNSNYKIIAALNFLSHHYKKEFSAKCPIFATQPGREPGAFWIVKK